MQLEYDLFIACSPSCIETGRFLCSFYISHPADFRYSMVNQQFWLQHFKETDLRHPDQPHDLHLVKPSTTSNAFAIKNNLVIDTIFATPLTKGLWSNATNHLVIDTTSLLLL